MMYPDPTKPVPVKEQYVGGKANDEDDMRPVVWEYLTGNLKRMPVLGGWIVAEHNVGMTFLPDPTHAWEMVMVVDMGEQV